MWKIWRWHCGRYGEMGRKVRLSFEGIFGEFEIVRICFGKKDWILGV